MKRLLCIIAFFAIWLSAYSQNVTKFLGIPIDGFKSEMISKLQNKGYIYHSDGDYLTGEFNGRDVIILVVTNNNKVYRLCVMDNTPTDEGQIKIQYNKLVGQFEANNRYIEDNDVFSTDSSQTLSDNEDISYEMSVNAKQYQAHFYQIDTTGTYEAINHIRANSSVEAFENLTENNVETLKKFYWLSNSSQNMVWFSIQERYGKYYLCMFYDNLRNQANGEDL